MFHRLSKPSKTNSFFIFGARGAGKTTFIHQTFPKNSIFINLLEEASYLRYSNHADYLISDLEHLKPTNMWIVIDEIQRVPNLLNVIHHLIETKNYKFILTGSSARKLKRSSANLLAGRAFQYQMYPLTHLELESRFQLEEYLQWGGLPKVYALEGEDRAEFLRSYTQTYLREEILQEQIVRNGVAFRNFLEIAAQTNGTLINYSKIGKDIGVDTKTIQNYFQILEDTLVGYFLPAFHKSIRKSVGLQPKFYLFDLGIKRAIEGTLSQTITPQTPAFGHAFEHFVICEAIRLNSYSRSDYSLYQYHTNSGGEIDLILTRGREVIAVEIKSTRLVDRLEVEKLERLAMGIKASKLLYVSQDPQRIKHGEVDCLNWKDFFKVLFNKG